MNGYIEKLKKKVLGFIFLFFVMFGIGAGIGAGVGVVVYKFITGV
jgi:hypothetical protein